LQQAASTPAVQKAYPIVIEEAPTPITAPEVVDPEVVRTMDQEVVQEIVPWQEAQERE